MTAYTVNFDAICKLTDDQFFHLCQANPELKFERNSNGELIILPPTGGETGRRNSELNADFVIWNRKTQLGKVFDSSTCFKLPDGANRSPDVAWIRADRWNALTSEEQTQFPPIAPDFVLELMSATDSLPALQAKMREYRDCQGQLGWLIVPQSRQVEIYRQGQIVEVLRSPRILRGEDVLPGFVLELSFVWA
ncbi:MAG: Uma2 family endonuclease [Cyanobacteria bacterium P01_A01_bin.17]